ncbi:MAG: Rho termination factor N-terminal domain-containing protein, partial [Myxococcaceae bacterium]|nr:Rho termination factor N-terminal domain-containing protein [Myxococcaceae bacterium]
MRKARPTTREKTQATAPVQTAVEERPKRRRTRADEAPTASARRRTRREEEPREEVEEREEERVEAEGEEETAQVRPVLTAMPRPVRGDELEEAGGELAEPAAALPPPEAPAPALEARPGAPLQVLKLNDLKRMRITDLSRMAHDLDIEGYQGLKKQELIFALLSGIADKRFEVQAEGVLELMSDGYGFLRSADSDYQP